MPTPPLWLAVFTNRVSEHLHALDMLAPIGCHYHQEQDCWEVTVFCSSTEIVGGELDGQLTYSRFSVDVQAVIAEFDSVEGIEWQNEPAGKDDDLGAHLGIVGISNHHRIWLRILSKPPKGLRSGRVAHLQSQEFIELW